MKKPESKEPSCPLWLATYGDMVTNMLVFFVLLLSMSEIKQEQRFIEFMQAVQEAFGYVGGLNPMPINNDMVVHNENQPQLIIPTNPNKPSPTDEPGVRGKQPNVREIRPRDYYTDGGPIHFPPASAEITADAKSLVREYAGKLRGRRTQIELRCHTSRLPVSDTGYSSHDDLASARGNAVLSLLVEYGVDPERVYVSTLGTREPLVINAYTPPQHHQNDRVEVLQVNKNVDDYLPEREQRVDGRDPALPAADETAATSPPPAGADTGPAAAQPG
jgi:chemotaxis protein MotB